MRTATKQMDDSSLSVKFDSPMMILLRNKGIDFSSKEHTHNIFQCCEKRSAHSSHTCIHGMMDLVVETWIEQDVLKVSVVHYGEQNGDLMSDPEIVYRVDTTTGRTLPEMYQNRYLGVYQEAIFEKDGKTMVRPKLIKDLKSFTRTWASNLKTQGHTLVKGVEE